MSSSVGSSSSSSVSYRRVDRLLFFEGACFSFADDGRKALTEDTYLAVVKLLLDSKFDDDNDDTREGDE